MQKAFQKALANCGPLSEVTSSGSPCRRKTFIIMISAVSLADGSLVRGTKCADLETRSTIVRITDFPWDSGKPVTKSMAICDHGRCETGSGWSKPWGFWELALVRAQTGQDVTNSLRMVFHQNLRNNSARVRLTPG